MKMDELRCGALALALTVGGTLAGCASAPPNLPAVRLELTEYMESGRYARDVAAAVAPARRYLERHASRVERPAIVLDIDETSISTWEYQEETNFCYTRESFWEWSAAARPRALAPTLELYRSARARDVAVFFVTGRRERLREVTERTLRDAGYGSWDGLFLRPEDDDAGSVVPYKSGARREIEGMGYTILLNLGDQRSDLGGGHTRRAVLLPNPFYGVP